MVLMVARAVAAATLTLALEDAGRTARSVWWWWLWFWTSRRATAEFAVVTASGAGVEGGVGGTKGLVSGGLEQWPMAQEVSGGAMGGQHWC